MTYNTANLGNHFYLINTAREQFYFSIDNNILFYKGETKSFKLQTADIMTGKIANFKIDNYRVMMEV